MLNKLWTWLVNYVLSLFAARQTEQAIEKDKAAIDQKVEESKAELARLNELGQLKVQAANEAEVLTAKVAESDKAVKDAEAETTRAIDQVRDVKPTTGIAQSDLQKKLDDLDL